MDTVAYFYNLHVNQNAFLHCIDTVKKYSPGSDIFLFTDKTLDSYKTYIMLANYLQLPIEVRDTPATFIDRADPLEVNLAKMQEYIARMYTACKKTHAKWLVRLEDDVEMVHPINTFPSTTAGGNWHSYGMGGASIFQVAAFIDVYERLGPTYIDRLCRETPSYAWAGDGLFKRMFVDNGYTFSKWVEITEDWHSEDKNAAFHHGNKSRYNKDYLKQRGL